MYPKCNFHLQSYDSPISLLELGSLGLMMENCLHDPGDILSSCRDDGYEDDDDDDDDDDDWCKYDEVYDQD